LIDLVNARDLDQLKRLVIELSTITRELGSTRKYSTIVMTGTPQVLLLKNGEPIMGFSISCDDEITSSGKVSIEKFIDDFDDSIHPRHHLAVLYDNPILARMFEFQYVRNGLELGNRCLYALAQDDVESPDSIRIQMDSFGINTLRHVKNGTLKLTRISDPARDPQGFAGGADKLVRSLIETDQSSVLPLRLVIHMRYLLNNREEIDGHSEYERILDSSFGSFCESVLCIHCVDGYVPGTHGEWVKNVLSNHDIIFVVCSKKNVPYVMQNAVLSCDSSRVNLKHNEEDLKKMRIRIRRLSSYELEGDIAETKNDIGFIEGQLRADLESYSASDLQNAIAKFSFAKQRLELLNNEYLNRKGDGQSE